ncbi:2-oxoacid:acceptor oxidoreductase family protein [Candidatus Acetothermia bacterium]|nr:2-oxoacid:acceptor oxidoreductase family protein [Candidatus Acetothermia bacterium]MBI3460261.1 2-oxoacid:acceptor oxidoreductase family protein [Candidatus Acetothermia bacterium]MBI3661291.1 2-oxoacid:acceptor oxidoreductase family protein [Candidatus Acetothermia bacterium]
MSANLSSTQSSRDLVQIRLSGAGGQGLITAGIILAEAALLDGKNVVQTQSYGPEARLGASKAEVIISSKKIAYPQVTKPDWLLCLSQDAFQKYASQTNADTAVIVDSGQIESDISTDRCLYRLPMTEAATKTGSKVVANVVALGAMNRLAGLVTPKNLREAVSKRVPERFRTLNIKALEVGEELAAQLKEQLDHSKP